MVFTLIDISGAMWGGGASPSADAASRFAEGENALVATGSTPAGCERPRDLLTRGVRDWRHHGRGRDFMIFGNVARRCRVGLVVVDLLP